MGLEKTVQLELSKSQLNRALILQSFAPDLAWRGDSGATDVRLLQKALSRFSQGCSDFDCGHGGTTFRFLVARISRQPGSYQVKVSSQLRSRPHGSLIDALGQLGVQCEWRGEVLYVESAGWCQTEILQVRQDETSQAVSAILLAAVDLPFDLRIQRQGRVSEPYLQMTVDLLRQAGIQVEGLQVKSGQKIVQKTLSLEVDASNAWAVLSVLGDRESLCFQNFFPQTQADARIFDLWKQWGQKSERRDHDLVIHRGTLSQAVTVNVLDAPDLFPCLVALLSLTPYAHRIAGLTTLRHKESDRLRASLRLLDAVGKKCLLQEDELILSAELPVPRASFEFFPEGDHRMAFAAAVFKARGFRIHIHEPECVKKSFPDFWTVVGVQP